jgi:hypothetical protein
MQGLALPGHGYVFIGAGTPARKMHPAFVRPAAKGVTFAYRPLAPARRRGGRARPSFGPRQKA